MKMIQQKKSSDDAVYERALQSDDPGMKAYVQWYDRGKRPVNYKTPEKERAREIMLEYMKDHSWTEVANLGIHNNLITLLRNKRYRHLTQERAELVIQRWEAMQRN